MTCLLNYQHLIEMINRNYNTLSWQDCEETVSGEQYKIGSVFREDNLEICDKSYKTVCSYPFTQQTPKEITWKEKKMICLKMFLVVLLIIMEKIYWSNRSSWWKQNKLLTMTGIQILGLAQKWVFVVILTPKRLNLKSHVESDSSHTQRTFGKAASKL